MENSTLTIGGVRGSFASPSLALSPRHRLIPPALTCVVHHFKKPNGQTEGFGDVNMARGASAVAAAARVVHTLGVMSEASAKKYSVPEAERKWFVRLDSAKGNFSPPAEREEWFKRTSVKLPNNDDVGVLKYEKLTVPEKEITMDLKLQDAIVMVFERTEKTEMTVYSMCQYLEHIYDVEQDVKTNKSTLRRKIEAIFIANNNVIELFNVNGTLQLTNDSNGTMAIKYCNSSKPTGRVES